MAWTGNCWIVLRNDWTVDPATGISNSSPKFHTIVAEVERLLRTTRLGDDLGMRARSIVALLAYKYGFVPTK